MSRTTRTAREAIAPERLVQVASHLGRAAALLVSSITVATLVGCSTPPAAPTVTHTPPKADYPVTITDDASRSVTIAKKPERIVSLAPANTEILFALGAGDRVVGVTSYDDYPQQVESIAKVGDFAGPNIEAVAAAKPDLVLVTGGVQADVIGKLEELGATVVSVDPQSLQGLYEDITEVGQAVGARTEAEEVIAGMKRAVASVEQAVAGREPVSAFVEIGQDPLFTVGSGTLIDELITIARGKNIVTEAGYVPYSSEQVLKADPVVYLATLGSMSDPEALKKRAGFKALSAVKNERVFILDDNLVSRPGPRVVEGLGQIARGLHPDAFGQ